MYYYPHHIGDFIADTSRLTDSQCMAYLRLIWHYYDTEKPLENDPESLAFKIGANASDVNLILKHYFIIDGDVWRKTRCDNVIAEYHGKADKARKSAEARWKNADAKRTNSERNANAYENNANASKIDANQEPITNNQDKELKDITAQAPSDVFDSQEDLKPVKQKKPDYPDWFEEIWKEYPSRAGGDSKKTAFQKASARLKENITTDQLLFAVGRYRRYILHTGRLNTEYVKQAATFFGNKDNIENEWKLPVTGANHGNQPKSPIERFMQQHYPDAGTGFEDDRRPMGGDDGAIRGAMDSELRGSTGQIRPVATDLIGDFSRTDS